MSPARRPARPVGVRATAPAAVASAAVAPRPMVEADASMVIQPNGRAATNGTVRLERTFMLKLVKHLLRKPTKYREVKVAFDPATRTYGATGKIKLFGLWLPVTARAHATSDQGLPAFQFDELAVRWGPGGRWSFSPAWLRGKVTQLLAESMTEDGYTATALPKTQTVRIEPNALLREIGALPDFTAIDTATTRFAAQTEADGAVVVSLRSDVRGPRVTATPRSDFAIEADDAALAAIFARALGRDFEVKSVQASADRLLVGGTVEYKPVSDVVNGLKALAYVLSQGHTDASIETVRGPLRLDVAVQGTRVTLTPSLKAAVPELVETLKKAGVAYTATKTSITCELTPLLLDAGVEDATVKVGSNRLSTEFHIDIPSRIKNPNLKPD